MAMDSLRISGLSDSLALHPAKKADSPAKVHEVATQFEALLIQQMLQASHSDTEENGNSIMSDFAEQHLAQALAERGGFGIAKMVVANLNKNAD
jgi:Rod binding domain-containing protein